MKKKLKRKAQELEEIEKEEKKEEKEEEKVDKEAKKDEKEEKKAKKEEKEEKKEEKEQKKVDKEEKKAKREEKKAKKEEKKAKKEEKKEKKEVDMNKVEVEQMTEKDNVKGKKLKKSKTNDQQDTETANEAEPANDQPSITLTESELLSPVLVTFVKFKKTRVINQNKYNQMMDYLDKFNTPEWKFNKRHQSFLLQFMYYFDDNSIYLDYLKSLNQHTIETSVNRCNELILFIKTRTERDEFDLKVLKRAKKIVKTIQ
jgi:hypothetical protein